MTNTTRPATSTRTKPPTATWWARVSIVQLSVLPIPRLAALQDSGARTVKVRPDPGVGLGQHVRHRPNSDAFVHQHGNTVADCPQAVQIMRNHEDGQTLA